MKSRNVPRMPNAVMAGMLSQPRLAH